jgi:two-component system LytT family response regulator
MRALIVDDEIHSREEMEVLLEETGAFVLAGKCANALEALRGIRTEHPDVVFLDVQMPAIDGFEFLGMIDETTMPQVVFVSAHDEYAVKAFEKDALDYLLKPVEKDRLAKTVVKLRRRLETGERRVYSASPIRQIPCILASKIKLIPAADVEYVRSTEAGVYVICPAGEFFTELTLAVLERQTSLVRCHKQFLVNIDKVDEIVLRENLLAEIKTKAGRTLPVSRRHLKLLRDRLNF